MVVNESKVKINGFSLESINYYTVIKTMEYLELFFKNYPDKAIDLEGYRKLKKVSYEEVKDELKF